MKKNNPIRTLLWLTDKLFPTVGNLIYETLYFVQRGIYGWSKRDYCSVYSHLDEKIPEMLRWLKIHKPGTPIDFVEMAQKRNEENGVPTIPEAADCEQGKILYNAMLDEIIEGFEAHKKIMTRWEFDEKEYLANEKAWRAKFLRGMELFAKHYDTLWD